MKKLLQLVLMAILLAALLGCSTDRAATAENALPAARIARVSIPAGTRISVALIDALGSDISSVGDRFTASLVEPLVIGGKTLLEKGTRIGGRVVSADESGRVKGVARIQLELTEILRASSAGIPITTDTFTATADSTKKRDAEVIAGGTGIGAAIGAIAGGKKGAGIGAIVGGGVGTGGVLATKGKEIHYGPETRLSFILANSVEL
jgi:hypothetical protein